MEPRIFLFFGIILTTFYVSHGCQMEGISNWLLPVSASMLDTFRGIVFSRSTTNIEEINSVNFGQGLNSGPYLDVSLNNSQFYLVTNNAYTSYEENETEESFSITVTFRCTGGTTSTLVLLINVEDTNNNAPQFVPSAVFEFTVTPPLPPGFLITGCLNDITVRDIDLTTQRIDFSIQDNPYFEIEYDNSSTTNAKEFKAILRTTVFIRSLSELLSLRITATDVDLTGDPPLTTSAIIHINADSEFEFPEEPVFAQSFYIANYTNNHEVVHENIALQRGYDDRVEFSIEGEYSTNFGLVKDGNQLSLVVTTQLPHAVFRELQIFLVVRATREYTSGDTTTVIVHLPEEASLEFERAHYEGVIVNNTLQISQLTLSQGYKDGSISVVVINEYSSYFSAISQNNSITLTMSPLPENIIDENNFINLEVVASTDRSSATTIVTLEIIKDDNVTPILNKPIYMGTYDPSTALTIEQITIIQGYDETVALYLRGEHANYFEISTMGSTVTLTSSRIPPELYSEQNIFLSLEATKPRTVGANAAIVITLPTENQDDTDVAFDKLLYKGFIQNNVVQHESIIVSGFTGTNVQLSGGFASAFSTQVSNGEVSVQLTGTVALPANVTHIVLELTADSASAVLLLNVNNTESPVLPTVSFGSPSYVLRVEVDKTGIIGQVAASADNGEAISYTLLINNAHLQSRVSVNNEGELRLSAPAASGVYTFQVVATSVITRVSDTAMVYLTVDTITVCGDDIVIPPLIILNRDEEESHNNLVVINETQHVGCRYSLTNQWPVDQSWLYVDENGLHTRPIDREHESIAFMALSQVQVELILECDTNHMTRTKRSLTSERTDWLGPYDYGTKNWILSDTILYNSRRSLVNLIVNDINDNAPIFIDKENEPIVVGYPIPELEGTVLPRSLAELQATDADIGENAALLYWSSEPVLAVAPLNGFVHVRDGARLEQDARLIVNATDRNGEGLTGSIYIQVKLLDVNNIVVVTVRNAFLDDEKMVLANISNAIGYEIKTLSSTVISDDIEDVNSRKKRDTSNIAGASLQLYVYGLIEREPVEINRLITDINNNAGVVNIASTLSLQDYLEGLEICVLPGRDIGLLVATIVLSILLFILILLIVVWFCLRRNKNYEEFRDDNSLTSRNDSLSQSLKPENITRPRLDIEELKRSERRLQEMLDAPIPSTSVEPIISKKLLSPESKVDMQESRPPLVIQSIDKLKDAEEESSDDEYGERRKSKRKSIVTFNENVEKIIHMDDADDPEREQRAGQQDPEKNPK